MKDTRGADLGRRTERGEGNNLDRLGTDREYVITWNGSMGQCTLFNCLRSAPHDVSMSVYDVPRMDAVAGTCRYCSIGMTRRTVNKQSHHFL